MACGLYVKSFENCAVCVMPGWARTTDLPLGDVLPTELQALYVRVKNIKLCILSFVFLAMTKCSIINANVWGKKLARSSPARQKYPRPFN